MSQETSVMNVRRAMVEDAAQISALLEDVHQLHVDAHPEIFKPVSPEVFPPETVAALMTDPNVFFFLAEESEEVVGYLQAELRQRPESPFRYEQNEIHVHHISVKPTHKHRGHGERLMDAAKELMHIHNADTLTLNVWAFNHNAQAFFRAQGLEPLQMGMRLRTVETQ